MSPETWPFPSESAAVGRRLHLAEGVCFGGLGSLLAVRFLPSLADVVANWPPSVSPGLVVVGAIGLLVFGRRFAIVGAAAREADVDRSPVAQDWHETRRWSVVAAVVAATVVVVLAVVLLVPLDGYWERIVPPGAVTLVGLAGYVYCWRRLGEL